MRYAIFAVTAVLELSGCYLIWMGQRQSSWLYAISGVAVLAGFGYTLAQVSDNLPGRAYAAYGGIYIASALAWMIIVDRHKPDTWDMTGVAISIVGALVILLGPRG